MIDAVGMEAHGSGIARTAQTLVGYLPDALARKAMTTASVDRTAAILLAVDAVRRGGTISLSGVYAGTSDPLPLQTMFDKQVQVRMGQANVRRWVDDVLPLAEDSADPLGLADFATHRLALQDAPRAYQQFQEKTDGTVKVLFTP